MKFYKLSITSLIFNVGTIIGLVIVNREIALRYISSDGKTKALFSLVEYSFSYKYYFIISGTFSLILAIFAIKKQEAKWLAFTVLILSLFSIVLVFIEFWKLFI